MPSKQTFGSINKIKNSEENCNMILPRPEKGSMTLKPKFISFNIKTKALKERFSNLKLPSEKNMKLKQVEEFPISIKTLPMHHVKINNSEEDLNS